MAAPGLAGSRPAAVPEWMLLSRIIGSGSAVRVCVVLPSPLSRAASGSKLRRQIATKP
jgi:hypothetical protein